LSSLARGRGVAGVRYACFNRTGASDRTRESVFFIGTQFSNLYTAVDTPARGRVGDEWDGKGKRGKESERMRSGRKTGRKEGREGGSEEGRKGKNG
jgi:hypothetical protein